MSEFKYCKSDKVDGFVVTKKQNSDDNWCGGLAQSRSLREIAYQLKRIADKLEKSE